jgi:hypothetical protein
LPEVSTIRGYALDIAGKMIDGVAVEKHRGREVFEKIVPCCSPTVSRLSASSSPLNWMLRSTSFLAIQPRILPSCAI